MKNLLVDGATYQLGSTNGRYDSFNDVFVLGNCFVSRGFTIYANDAGLFLSDLARREIIRNNINAQSNFPYKKNFVVQAESRADGWLDTIHQADTWAEACKLAVMCASTPSKWVGGIVGNVRVMAGRILPK